MLIIFITIVIISLLLQRRWRRLSRQIALASQLKSNSRSLPILGNILIFYGSDEDRMKTIKNMGRFSLQNGGISKYWHLNQLNVCIADPESARIVMDTCLEKNEYFLGVTRFLLGNASIFSPVKIWRPRRKMVATNFKTKNIHLFSGTFSKKSYIMADLMEKEAGKGTFSFWKYIPRFTMDSVCETTLGIPMNSQESKNEILLDAITTLFEIGARTLYRPWLRNNWIIRIDPEFNAAVKCRQIVLDFITKVVQEKQKNIKNEKKTVNEESGETTSFVDIILENDQSQSESMITTLIEECLVLIFAGTDTSSIAVGYAMLLLSRNLDVQDKVYEELQAVLGDEQRPVTLQDLPRLKYLEAIIRETLRLYPSVPVIVRYIDRDITLKSGMTLVKDCGALINIWGIHRNPEYWGEDADQFRPERFLNSPPQHPAAFIAFSYGMRGCPGTQYGMISMKILLATLLHRFRVLAPVGDEGEIRTQFKMTMKPVDNYNIRLERRK